MCRTEPSGLRVHAMVRRDFASVTVYVNVWIARIYYDHPYQASRNGPAFAFTIPAARSSQSSTVLRSAAVVDPRYGPWTMPDQWRCPPPLYCSPFASIMVMNASVSESIASSQTDGDTSKVRSKQSSRNSPSLRFFRRRFFNRGKSPSAKTNCDLSGFLPTDRSFNDTDQRGPGVDHPFVKTDHWSSVASDGSVVLTVRRCHHRRRCTSQSSFRL